MGLTSNSNINLRSLAPECLQIVDSCHLMRSIVGALQPDIAQVRANVRRQFAGTFMNRFLHGLRNTGIKKQQINFFIVLVPLPDADDATIQNDGGERIVNQLSLPTGERLIGMFGWNESVDNLALSFEVRIAIRNEIQGEFRRFETKQCIEIGFADEKFILRIFDVYRYQFGLHFARTLDGISYVDTRPPCEVFHACRRFGSE